MILLCCQAGAEDASRVVREFMEHISAVSPVPVREGYPEEQIALRGGSFKVENQWGVFFVTTNTHRVGLYRAVYNPADEDHARDWREGFGLTRAQAESWAATYVRSAGFDMDVRIKEPLDLRDSCYRFEGVASLAGLPIFESDVSVDIGHVTGCLQFLHVSTGNDGDVVPSLPPALEPKLSVLEAALVCDDYCQRLGHKC